MIVSTGPDLRYGVQLNNGRLITGSRKHVLEAAVYAWKNRDVGVSLWIVPGKTDIIRKQRVERLQSDYMSAL